MKSSDRHGSYLGDLVAPLVGFGLGESRRPSRDRSLTRECSRSSPFRYSDSNAPQTRAESCSHFVSSGEPTRAPAARLAGAAVDRRRSSSARSGVASRDVREGCGGGRGSHGSRFAPHRSGGRSERANDWPESLSGLGLATCDLVVLSACDSGLGRMAAAGQGAMSLSRAFREAGARTVISSLWCVRDDSTKELMLDFYDRPWNKGESKLDALRDAPLAMVKKNREKHGDTRPGTWGAFVLMGRRSSRPSISLLRRCYRFAFFSASRSSLATSSSWKSTAVESAVRSRLVNQESRWW